MSSGITRKWQQFLQIRSGSLYSCKTAFRPKLCIFCTLLKTVSWKLDHPEKTGQSLQFCSFCGGTLEVGRQMTKILLLCAHGDNELWNINRVKITSILFLIFCPWFDAKEFLVSYFKQTKGLEEIWARVGDAANICVLDHKLLETFLLGISKNIKSVGSDFRTTCKVNSLSLSHHLENEWCPPKMIV